MVKNGGTDYRPKGDPWRVNVHDFEDKKLGKVVSTTDAVRNPGPYITASSNPGGLYSPLGPGL
jgi:hypothetical protein